ncbi:cytochrome C oxidase subunit III [candidate division KSB1 bacterium RBG_16_48_16]|nr:MAG: cytochrome C oxidase subunit III [candidate division KSB1 bacterium RBG_16_48_16]
MSLAHNHPAYLAHHFSDMEQQKASAKLGMWIFLLTEILLFGGLFCAYAVFRSWNPQMFLNAHKHLNVILGTVNTAVLISSSLTMALAIRSLQVDKKRPAIIFLLLTLAFAATFLVIKYFEYAHKIHLGQLPGKFYTYTGIEGTNPHIFFSIYFAMTGLHGLHILVGMIVISWVLVNTVKDKYSSEYYTPVENAGLYWHLVDLIWIYLFPLLYLIG